MLNGILGRDDETNSESSREETQPGQAENIWLELEEEFEELEEILEELLDYVDESYSVFSDLDRTFVSHIKIYWKAGGGSLQEFEEEFERKLTLLEEEKLEEGVSQYIQAARNKIEECQGLMEKVERRDTSEYKFYYEKMSEANKCLEIAEDFEELMRGEINDIRSGLEHPEKNALEVSKEIRELFGDPDRLLTFRNQLDDKVTEFRLMQP